MVKYNGYSIYVKIQKENREQKKSDILFGFLR